MVGAVVTWRDGDWSQSIVGREGVRFVFAGMGMRQPTSVGDWWLANQNGGVRNEIISEMELHAAVLGNVKS